MKVKAQRFVNKHLRAAKIFAVFSLIFLGLGISMAYAGGQDISIGSVASTITGSMRNLASLITAGSYVAGFGFAVGAILKFKQHKDNPTQIPIGTPIALVFIAAALIFLPSIFAVSEYTVFGTSAEVGGASGVASFT